MPRKTKVPSISYRKLWEMCEERNISNLTSLFSSLKVSSETLNAMRNGYNISLGVIDKLCAYFNCQPCDIMEFIQSD